MMLPRDTTAAETDDPVSDEALMLRFRDQHDQQALNELIHRYERPLYNYLLRYTGNPNLAEELFQVTFERVFERRDQYQSGRRLKPWIFSIASHLAIDSARRTHRQRTLPLDASVDDDSDDVHKLFELLSDGSPTPAVQLEKKEWGDWVRQAIKQLADELKSVILLAYYQGLTLREVAETLGVPLGTVKSRLHKALLQLNMAWKRTHHGECA